MKEHKIAMIGCLQVGYEIVKYLLENGIQIEYFITITKKKAEEQNVSGFFDYSDLAAKYNIPVYHVTKYSLQCDTDIDFFKAKKFDLVIQGGWQRLFPPDVLKTFRIGALGIHGSAEFLPKGRGRSPINWSLIEGKRRFIMHFFIIKPGIDDGDIFYWEMFDINEWDDCNTLYYKNSIISKRVFLKFIPLILISNFSVIPQVGVPTYYPKRTEEDGLIDWEKDVFMIYNFIRALTKPYPGAFGYIKDIKFTFWKAQPFDTKITYRGAQIGEIVEVFHNGDVVINCLSGLMLVTEYESAIFPEINQVFTCSKIKILQKEC